MPIVDAEKASARGIHSVIDLIGDDGFAAELLLLLHDICGARHCAIFQLDGAEPIKLGAASLDGSDSADRSVNSYLSSSLWRSDPTMAAARFTFNSIHPMLIQTDARLLEDKRLRQVIYPSIGDRLLICGRSAIGHIALSVLRDIDEPAFDPDAVHSLDALASPLLSVLGKHVSAVWQRQQLASSLSSLADIEESVSRSAVKFPRREGQVCARILYGVSSIGIALELGVSEETVMTYRKRVYSRLGIGTQRELLMWYVGLWNSKGAMPRVMPAGRLR